MSHPAAEPTMAGNLTPERRGHGGARRRPPLDLSALVVPAGTELAEWAVPVSEAADLVGTSFQIGAGSEAITEPRGRT